MEQICLNCRFAKYADDEKEDLRCLEPKFNMRLVGTILSNSVCEDDGCDSFDYKTSKIWKEISHDSFLVCQHCGRKEFTWIVSHNMDNTYNCNSCGKRSYK